MVEQVRGETVAQPVRADAARVDAGAHRACRFTSRPELLPASAARRCASRNSGAQRALAGELPAALRPGSAPASAAPPRPAAPGVPCCPCRVTRSTPWRRLSAGRRQVAPARSRAGRWRTSARASRGRAGRRACRCRARAAAPRSRVSDSALGSERGKLRRIEQRGRIVVAIAPRRSAVRVEGAQRRQQARVAARASSRCVRALGEVVEQRRARRRLQQAAAARRRSQRAKPSRSRP